LKEDGTVVATGKNKESQCNVSEWTDIVKIAAGHGFTVGLKKDGTVVCTEQFGKFDFFGWNDLADIFAGWNYVIGIKRDGSVISVGNNQYGQCDISNWSINIPSMQ
jgi:alpha-tubulin suppressor-like RCC1 family protein